MKKIVKGNDFTLRIPVMKMVEGQAKAFPLPACTDVVVQVCNQFKRIPLAFEIDVKEDNVLLARVEGDKMSLGTYAIEVKGKIFGNDWRSNEYPQFAIVANNADADTEFGETDEGDNSVEMDTAMVILPPSVELSDLISKANEVLKTSKETNDTINTNEEARKEAETLRGTAEQGRASAEEARVSAEGSRTKAEEGRVSAEAERVKAEQARTEIEITRQTSELTRKDDESRRVAAEGERAKAEKARVDAESIRANAESERVDAEAQRVSAEGDRANAEKTRADAETKRKSDFDTAIQAAETATAGAEKVNATLTEGNIFEVTDRTGAKKTLDLNITAEGSVDNVVGTPSVEITQSVENNKQKLYFNFKNIKGEKGDIGDKGDAFTYNDFTPEQLKILQDKVVESSKEVAMVEVNKYTDLVKLPNIEVPVSGDTVTLEPNKVYNIAIGESLTLVLAPQTDTTITNEYQGSFDTGSTAPTVTFPADVIWTDTPSVVANTHYEFNIRYTGGKYYGLVQAWEINTEERI